jgi:hypothetical protein
MQIVIFLEADDAGNGKSVRMCFRRGSQSLDGSRDKWIRESGDQEVVIRVSGDQSDGRRKAVDAEED